MARSPSYRALVVRRWPERRDTPPCSAADSSAQLPQAVSRASRLSARIRPHVSGDAGRRWPLPEAGEWQNSHPVGGGRLRHEEVRTQRRRAVSPLSDLIEACDLLHKVFEEFIGSCGVDDARLSLCDQPPRGLLEVSIEHGPERRVPPGRSRFQRLDQSRVVFRRPPDYEEPYSSKTRPQRLDLLRVARELVRRIPQSQER